MKKKNLKSLNLNKSSISDLNAQTLKGGDYSLMSIGCNFTKGDCVDTLGDDHCWTPLATIGW